MSPRKMLPTLMLSCLAATALVPVAQAVDANASRGGWRLEEGTATPSYAVADATRTTLNVETVVLACEPGADKGLLQLQLYMSDEGALQPTYPTTAKLKGDPTAVVAIDGQDFPVSLLFADDHVVLADAQDGQMPMLSTQLRDALQSGKTMVVKADLLEKAPGAPAIDGETVVNLQGGRQALAAISWCATAGNPSVAEVHTR